MNKKLISVLCAVSCVTSLFVAAQAKTTDIINDDFSNNSAEGYVINDPSEGNASGSLSSASNELKFECSCDWDVQHGIKKDISAELRAQGLKKGDTLNVSLKVSSAWYDNPAQAVVKINDQTISFGEGVDASERNENGDLMWKQATLTGSATVDIDIPASYTAYFIVTQPCGTLIFDDIHLTLEQEDTTPPGPVDPGDDDDPSDGDYTKVLDTTGMDIASLQAVLGTATDTKLITFYGDSDGYKFPDIDTNDGNAFKGYSNYAHNNGFKIDISKFVKDGSSVKVDFVFKSSENNNSDRLTKAYLVEEDADSNMTSMEIFSQQSSNVWTDYTSTVAKVSNTAEKVYLAFTDNSDQFWVKNVQILVEGGTGDVYVDTTKFEFECEQGCFEVSEDDGVNWSNAETTFESGSLKGATLTDAGKYLRRDGEVVSVWNCQYTTETDLKGLVVKVFVPTSTDSQDAQITTEISANSPIAFYVVTNCETIDHITPVPVE